MLSHNANTETVMNQKCQTEHTIIYDKIFSRALRAIVCMCHRTWCACDGVRAVLRCISKSNVILVVLVGVRILAER